MNRADDSAMPIYSVLPFQLFAWQIYPSPIKYEEDNPAYGERCIHCLHL